VCQNKDQKSLVAFRYYVHIITSTLQKNVPGFSGTLLMVLYLNAVLYSESEIVKLNRLIMNSKTVIVIIACVWHVTIL
jgi:hypothetical protein